MIHMLNLWRQFDSLGLEKIERQLQHTKLLSQTPEIKQEYIYKIE